MSWTHTHSWKLGTPPAAVFAALTDAEELRARRSPSPTPSRELSQSPANGN